MTFNSEHPLLIDVAENPSGDVDSTDPEVMLSKIRATRRREEEARAEMLRHLENLMVDFEDPNMKEVKLSVDDMRDLSQSMDRARIEEDGTFSERLTNVYVDISPSFLPSVVPNRQTGDEIAGNRFSGNGRDMQDVDPVVNIDQLRDSDTNLLLSKFRDPEKPFGQIRDEPMGEQSFSDSLMTVRLQRLEGNVESKLTMLERRLHNRIKRLERILDRLAWAFDDPADDEGTG